MIKTKNPVPKHTAHMVNNGNKIATTKYKLINTFSLPRIKKESVKMHLRLVEEILKKEKSTFY